MQRKTKPFRFFGGPLNGQIIQVSLRDDGKPFGLYALAVSILDADRYNMYVVTLDYEYIAGMFYFMSDTEDAKLWIKLTQKP